MRRWFIVLLAVVVAISLAPMKTAQAASIIKTDDGLEFKMGLAQKVVFFTLDGLDLTSDQPACGGKDCNFRSFISPDTSVGSNPVGIWNFTNLLFDLSKGPVSIHVNLELEAAMDENVADINPLNVERANITWKTAAGDLIVGFDVHLLDPEGGLVYQDEDPGIWLIGNAGWINWNVGYHKRLERNRGVPLGNVLAQGLNPFQPDGRVKSTDVDTDIFEARLGFNFGGGGANFSIAPFFLAHIRHTPGAAGTHIISCPTGGVGPGTCGAGPTVDGRLRAEIYYPGLVFTAKLGPFSFTAEGAGQFGEIRELGPQFAAEYGGATKLDIESFAVFGEFALDLTSQGLGITPFLSIDWRRGDDNALDTNLTGYVPISDLSAALRKDGFKGQSISSLGPGPLGAGGDDGWGFNTTGRGVGPTIGTILEGFGADTLMFNSRWGKADNPGLLKGTLGVVGKLTPQIDLKAAASYFRFDTTEPIQQEACRNRQLRGIGCASFSSIPLSKEMGIEFNANVGWSPVPAFRIQPFVSVFVPFDGPDDINAAFLGNRASRTAYLAGMEFRAQF